MKIKITKIFEKTAKKLHQNQVESLENAIEEITANPLIGELKKGDLHKVRVHKFRINNQLTLLAYIYNENIPELTFISHGPHENFYRDLKKTHFK